MRIYYGSLLVTIVSLKRAVSGNRMLLLLDDSLYWYLYLDCLDIIDTGIMNISHHSSD